MTSLRYRVARWLMEHDGPPWLADIIGGVCPVHGERFSEDHTCEGYL